MKHESETRSFGRFLFRYKWALLLGLVFTLGCFAFMLTHFSLTIDEESWFNAQTPGILSWVSQGRFGIWLLDLLIAPNGNYVPFLWDWLAVILWFLAAPVFLYTVLQGVLPKVLDGRYGQFVVFVFVGFFASVPTAVGEILSYSMFNLQISIGLLCGAAASWFTMLFLKQKKAWHLPVAMLLLGFSISIYQAFLNLYVTWLVACMLLGLLLQNRGARSLLKQFGISAGVTLGGLVLYVVPHMLLTSLWGLSGTGMLEYIGAGSASSLPYAIAAALVNAARTLLARGMYGSYWGVVLSTVAFLVALVCIVVKRKNALQRVGILFLSALMMLSPFALFILLGTTNTPGRALFALSFLFGVQWFIILAFARSVKWARVLAIAVAALSLAYNALMMNRLFLDSYRYYQYDKAFAAELVQAIEQEGYDPAELPVFFVGAYTPAESAASGTFVYSGSTVASFFSWDGGSNSRMVNFLRAEGYEVARPTSGQVQALLPQALEMPNWPSAGAISEIDGCIVVKLSNPESDAWYQINASS